MERPEISLITRHDGFPFEKWKHFKKHYDKCGPIARTQNWASSNQSWRMMSEIYRARKCQEYLARIRRYWTGFARLKDPPGLQKPKLPQISPVAGYISLLLPNTAHLSEPGKWRRCKNDPVSLICSTVFSMLACIASCRTVTNRDS